MGQESQFQLSLCVCHFIKTQLNCLNTRTAGAEPTATSSSSSISSAAAANSGNNLWTNFDSKVCEKLREI